MAKKRRGRYVEVHSLHVSSEGKNLRLMFEIPAEAIREVLPHIKRFASKTKKVKRAKTKPTYPKT